MSGDQTDRHAAVVREFGVVGALRSFSGIEVLRRAERYEALGIKRFDALHLASAVETEVDCFCTTDDQLLRKGKEADTGDVSVVSPLEFVVLLQ